MMKVCHKITEEGLSEGVCRACVHRLRRVASGGEGGARAAVDAGPVGGRLESSH